jgi:Leucine-rich repeat (LRR) protein
MPAVYRYYIRTYMKSGTSFNSHEFIAPLLFGGIQQFTTSFNKDQMRSELELYLETDEIEQILQNDENHFARLWSTDIVWQELLYRLHAIDDNISTIPQGGLSARTAFITGFAKIKSQQQSELDFLSANHFIRTKNIGERKITLTKLEEQNIELDNYNYQVIMPIIIDTLLTKSTILNLSLRNLTRLPRRIFNFPELLHFLKNLEIMNCSHNHLMLIPNEMQMLTSLRMFVCHYNFLQSLPDSLFELPCLEKLYVGNNAIEKIEDTHFWSATLKVVDLDGNYLDQITDAVRLKLRTLQPRKMLLLEPFDYVSGFVNSIEESLSEYSRANRLGI